MCSIEEIHSCLNDPQQLIKYLRERPDCQLSDEIYSTIIEHYRSLPLTNENLSVQRNLYGRIRSIPLNSSEIDLLIRNICQCLSSNDSLLTTTFLQYLHNIHRLISEQFDDLPYLCALILRSISDKNVLSCLFSAYLDKDRSTNIRFDLTINAVYKQPSPLNEENERKFFWFHQLTKRLIEKDRLWLRKFYLEKIYSNDFIQIIDQHQREKFFTTETIQRSNDSTSTIERKPLSLTSIETLEELRSTLINYIENECPIEMIDLSSLFHLFSSSDTKTYPFDLHLLFICLSVEVFNRENSSLVQLRLFRELMQHLTNYYVHQEDMFDDHDYRLDSVYVVCHLLREVHRRRSSNEHQWYRLYTEVPAEHPLPTFDFFSDLLRLLATLCYNHLDCQDLVRNLSGTIESILSMTQIDLNQPKSSACVIWLLKCLTEQNEQNRIYIQQIR